MSDEPQTAQPAAKLTKRQEVFIEHYLTCWNATEAAKKAGYKDPEQAGYENKKKQEISRAIESRIKQLAMGADEVLARLAQIGRGSMEDFIDVDATTGGWTINLEKARERGVLHLIKSLEDSPKFGKKLELHDPQTALAHIGKHLGLFKDAAEQIFKYVDLSKLTPHQVQRIAQGDDILDVLLNPNG